VKNKYYSKVNEDKSKSVDRDGKNTGGENKNNAEKNTIRGEDKYNIIIYAYNFKSDYN